MNVLELIHSMGIELRKAASTHGGEYHGPCPGCGGEDRFHVWPEQNDGRGSYWCRGCEKGGDIIQFAIDFMGKSYPEACRYLNIEMSASTGYRSPRMPQDKKTSDRWRPVDPAAPSALWIEKADKFVEWAHGKLVSDPERMQYLQGRGIGPDMAAKYRLGLNPRDMWRPRESWGLATELKADGKKKKLWLPEGLVIPLLQNNRVHRIRIRRPEGSPRYYVIPGSCARQLRTLPGGRFAVVIESELDAVLIDQAAGDLVSAIALGNSSAKPDAEADRDLQQAALVLLALDYDAAGAKAIGWWEAHYRQVERWPVPSGTDPGEAYRAGTDIRAWIGAALPPGWDGGHSSSGRRKKEGASAVPSAVRELAELLRGRPVGIRLLPDQIKILENSAWASAEWETSRRISNLVFYGEGVMEYLLSLGIRVVTGDNILQAKAENGRPSTKERPCERIKE